MAQQPVKIDHGIILHDTPGILWPRIENPNSGYRLAITGCIRDTVTDAEDLALFMGNYLLSAYPQLLKKRYQLDKLPATEVQLLETIGQMRGCLRPGGVVDYEKAARLMLADLRSGATGKICLETPGLIESELSDITG
jgi:ribosome biogenesis GTPase A